MPLHPCTTGGSAPESGLTEQEFKVEDNKFDLTEMTFQMSSGKRVERMTATFEDNKNSSVFVYGQNSSKTVQTISFSRSVTKVEMCHIDTSS